MYLFSATVAAGLSVVLTPLAGHYGRRFGLVDEPGPRKVHARSIPCLGGVAIYLGFMAGAALTVTLARALGFDVSWERQGLVILGAGLGVFLIGVLDDLYDVPGKYKLLVITAAAAAVCGSGVVIDVSPLVPLGEWAWLASWLVTMLWIVAVATAVNFMDGLDGLAAGLVAIAAGTLLLTAGTLPTATGSMIYAAALLGGIGGFWFHNRHPARIFMGDGGSLFIGFVVACLAVLSAKQAGGRSTLLMSSLALSVPLLDLACTVVRRRFVQRRSIFSAERGHIHHKLLDLNLSHRQAVWVLHGFTAAAVAVGLMSLLAPPKASVAILLLVVPLLYGLFRATGSARVRAGLGAVRRTLDKDREARGYRDAFEQLQLEFAKVDGFGSWWDTVCLAAERLGFLSLRLAVTSRDGKTRTLRWDSVDPAAVGTGTPLNVRVPVSERRISGSLLIEAEVVNDTTLESACGRATLFTRLVEEFGLNRLRATERGGSESPAAGSPPPPAPPPAAAGPPKPEPVLPGLRVAVVHDFLYTYAGAERVLEQVLGLLPQADVFALFDFLPEGHRGFIGDRPVTTTFLQRMPGAKKRHRAYLPLMPLAIEQLDVTGYDLVLSSSYLAAKGVITGPGQCHICYCHSPVRYAWDLQHQYLDEANLGFGPRGLLARSILHYVRNWDIRSSGGVDRFVANSDFVRQRIEKLYRREAEVIHPPVATHSFTPQLEKEDFYVSVSRLVGYKRMNLLVDAFNQMPDRRLVIVGDGPEYENLRRQAGPNVRIAGHLPLPRLRNYLGKAKAFVFAAEEDFGIVPVEAMACGTPVIAYGRGGARESVVPGRTGLFFDRQTPEAVVEAVDRYEAHGGWDHAAIAEHADRFNHEVFHERLGGFIRQTWAEFTRGHCSAAAGGGGGGPGGGAAAPPAPARRPPP
ncbi:MAG: glycosyltransferase, partial [Planctomycetota bacterium]